MVDRFLHPLSLQIILPDDYRLNDAFARQLETMRQLGLWGVELNISDPRGFDFEVIRRFLERFDLHFSMFATGLTARRLGLSLSDPDEAARRRAVQTCRELIDWIESSATGLIIGFMKGPVYADAAEAGKRFARSIAEIMPVAEDRRVSVLIEATNRYESSVARTIDEAASFVDGYPPECAQILPDTFHMNIEEADPFDAFKRNMGRIRSFHLSDNNRHFPGFGAIDFSRFASLLEQERYAGRLAIEGNVKNDLIGDLERSIAKLGPLFAAKEQHE